MAATDSGRPEPGPDAGIDELQADIERTRHELGETVGALADKVNVPARVRESVADSRGAAIEQAQRVQHRLTARPRDPAVVIAVLVAVAAVVWVRRRRRS
jgi:hypothetical protein